MRHGDGGWENCSDGLYRRRINDRRESRETRSPYIYTPGRLKENEIQTWHSRAWYPMGHRCRGCFVIFQCFVRRFVRRFVRHFVRRFVRRFIDSGCLVPPVPLEVRRTSSPGPYRAIVLEIPPAFHTRRIPLSRETHWPSRTHLRV